MSTLQGSPYTPLRESTSHFVEVRELRYHVRRWGDAVSEHQPPLVLLHGFMDVSASFQFMIDALAVDRRIFAPDLRGFGLTESPPVDSYWFPDYLGDVDALLDALCPGRTVDLLGHSMGGNVAMLYGGVRPERIRKLVNLEGAGMRNSSSQHAPERYRTWLNQLKTPKYLRSYDSLDAVADRMRENNPRLSESKALWLAARWARQKSDGRWHLLADPAHRRIHPAPNREEDVIACWKRITAPTLWVEGLQSDLRKRHGDAEVSARLTVVPQLERVSIDGSGHMLHHDQPEALAARIEAFLD